jgi:signal transduction histidine kinase
VIITAIRDESGQLIGFGKVTRDFTERMRILEALRHTNEELEKQVAQRARAERKLSDSEKSLRKLSLHLLRTQDEERRRIGRDLHDSLGQYLAVLKISLDSMALSAAAEEEIGQQVPQCVHLVEESIKELRTISYLLYPPMLEEMGLTSAIPWYLEGFAKRCGIKTTFDAPARFDRLPRDLELAVFRVLQESLTNVHRHSESPMAHVRLRIRERMVVLEIEDEGKGISPEILQPPGQDCFVALGVGLRGMNERLQQLGGRLEVCSTTKGTTVSAVVPLPEVAAATSEPA